ncbi:hypothetical protein R3P38DRAFT_1637342 [Favolaschia claudopus]|uniref:Arrestin-like N-terminal domain-containing protein n=1 Tax=Favolaschia claudopus TaxID=2862362 RepID=A0AAW0DKA4_9AGAR
MSLTVVAEVPPPAYDRAQLVAGELPTYSAPPSRPTAARTVSTQTPPKEFTFELKNYFSKPWARLTLLAHPTLSRTSPTFVQGSSIDGSLRLNLRSSDPIKSIAVVVRGDLVVSGDPDERSTFFRLRKYLWKPSMGDPSAAAVPGCNDWTEKLKGEYTWPFSIKLPEFVADPTGETEPKFRMPHTFAERSSRWSIDYYFELRIDRGKLRPDDSIITQFGYFAMQAPSRPSQLRQLAYRSGVDVPGPSTDPEGWHELEPVRIQGKLFGERPVDAICTVYLAKPLCYTRGTSIPCAMTIETEIDIDPQVADILASIRSSAVYLQRTVRCSLGRTTTSVVPCGQATWRPSTDVNARPLRSPTQRQLVGEIHLRKDLQPSTAIKKIQIEYAVAIFPPAAVGFKSQPITGPLLTQPVDIVTRYAHGVRQPNLATTPPLESLAIDHLVDHYYNSVSDGLSKTGAVLKLWSDGDLFP